MIFTLSNINYHIQTPISTWYLLEKNPDKVTAAQIIIHSVQVIKSMPGTDIKILICRKQKSDKLSQAKMNDLKSMLQLMSLTDRQGYASVGINEQ